MPGDIFINGNPFIETLYKFPCPQRVLMVADASLDSGSGGFGLSEFNLLASKLPEDEQKLASIMRDHDGLAIEGIAESLRAAEGVIVEQIGKALEATAGQLQTLRAQPVSAGKPVKRPKASGGGKVSATKKAAAKPKKATRK